MVFLVCMNVIIGIVTLYFDEVRCFVRHVLPRASWRRFVTRAVVSTGRVSATGSQRGAVRGQVEDLHHLLRGARHPAHVVLEPRARHALQTTVPRAACSPDARGREGGCGGSEGGGGRDKGLEVGQEPNPRVRDAAV
jgi:hypothetical protein